MTQVRRLLPAVLCTSLLATQLAAQTGTVTGRVVDATTLRPVSSANVLIEGTQRGILTGEDGVFVLTGVPVGAVRLTAGRIGYTSETQDVTVAAEATTRVQFTLSPEAVALEQLVATGYGTQRRLAITGSVATIDADVANVGVTSNANDLIQGRAAGVHITVNNGEPGAGAQVRIRGGTSISASNEPLYVIDGVAIENVQTEATGIGISGDPALPRSPLNLLNPADIERITVLKDAAAAAIYGARGANGVIVIETKRGAATGGLAMEYDGYVATASPASSLDVLTGDQYRQFVQQQVTAGRLPASRLASLGTANTDWEEAVTRDATTHNHNLSFSGGTEQTRYRASLNYMNQEGVALSSGLERIQGRVSGTHHAWGDRLRMGLNLTGSHIQNDYLPFEAGGGFEGGTFVNMAIFNPTFPVTTTDPATGQSQFFELGAGSQSVRNPVAIAEQVLDFARTSRILGNATAALDLLPGVTGQVSIGIDRSDGTRRTYLPRISPVGASFEGLARQVNRDNTALTFQGLLTGRHSFAEVHNVEIVGGYEYNDYSLGEFTAGAQGFLTDAFSFNRLEAGRTPTTPLSFREESKLVSFFSRANYSLNDRYFLTGVVRTDGSSRFGAGNKWAFFPAISGSWRMSEEAFLRGGPFSELRLRAGWGKQGNQAVPAYASLILLQASDGSRYVFGEQPVVGVAPTRNPNPNLKWEETTQWNVAVDYGFANNRFTGSVEYYLKDTDDLLLEVGVPQPASVDTRLENVGSVRNRGLEATLDARVIDVPDLSWLAGIVFSADRNEVVDLGPHQFITTAFVSGQGQSNVTAQRIMPGEPLGTFWGPVFVGVGTNSADTRTFGKQLFRCTSRGATDTMCVNGIGPEARPADYTVLGDANPDFTLGFRSQIGYKSFDASFLVRAEVGQEVFNNTALVYATKTNVLQDRNFLASALDDPTAIGEPAIFSSRWIEDGSFMRLQNVTVGYTFDLPAIGGEPRRTRVYLSGDNLLLLTGYSGLDPEVHSTHGGLAVRGIDYLVYPRARTVTAGVRVAF